MIFGKKIKKLYICNVGKQRERAKRYFFNLAYIYSKERTRGTKKIKISQNSLKAQFASERLKSRSRFFERVGNRWGVQKFLSRKPKIKISVKRSKRSQRKAKEQSNKFNLVNLNKIYIFAL